MVRFEYRTLADTIAWTANRSGVNIPIPRDRFIQRMAVRVTGCVDTDASVAPTLQEDNPLGIIKAIYVTANGNDTQRRLRGDRLWYLNSFRHATPPERVTTPIATGESSTEFAFNLFLDFMRDPRNPFDISAMMPAQVYSSLKLFIDWGTGTDLDTNGKTTLVDATATVTLREGTMSNAEIRAAYGRELQRLQKIYESEQTKTNVQNTNYQFTMDLPVGHFINAIGVFAYDNTIRSDAIVNTQFRLQQKSPLSVTLTQSDWMASQNYDKAEMNLDTILDIDVALTSVDLWNRPLRGLTIIDTEAQGGLDTRNMKSGDVQYQANIGAITGTSETVLVVQEIV